MQETKYNLAQKITGQERKVVAGKIAEAAGEEVKYLGPPSFAYKAGDWTVDKAGVVHSPEMSEGISENLKAVTKRLTIEGLKPEGDIAFTFPATGHTGITLCNLINLIASKEKLFMKAFGRQSDIMPKGLVEYLSSVKPETMEAFITAYKSGFAEGRFSESEDMDFSSLPENLTLSFFNATFDALEIISYVMFCVRLNEQAKKQKYASARQRANSCDRFSFRCFLLKLGFIGDTYKAERKVLISRLEGSSSYAKPQTDKNA